MKHSRRDAAFVLLLLFLILALAAGLRFYQLGQQSLWSDEGNSAALATRSLIQIARDASYDIHPPLYYWLLSLWVHVFGTSETALRSLSAVLGVLLVLVIAELGRRLHNKTVGLAAGFIAAISPFQIYYSQEARMYMLLALEAALSVLLFWRFVAREDRELPPEEGPLPDGLRWLPVPGVLLALVWILGLYTHYAFPLMIALATVLYLGWVWATRGRGLVGVRLLRWGVLLGLALVFYLPWAMTAIRQITTWPSGKLAVDIGQATGGSLMVVGLGPIARGWLSSWWGWLLIVVALVGALPWAAMKLVPPERRWALDRLAWLTPVAWVLAPLAMILALGLYREAYLKFLLIASPALTLLVARGVLAPARWLDVPSRPPAGAIEPSPIGPYVRSVVGALWILCTLAVIGGLSGAVLARYYNDPKAARDDYRGIVQFIGATAGLNDAIVLDAPGQLEVFDYYYHDNLPIYALPRQRPMNPQVTEQELTRLLDHDKVYAVYWATDEADPEGLIQGWLDGRGYKTLDQWRGDVRLAVYVMPEHRPPDESVEDLDLRFGEDIRLLGYSGWNVEPTAGEVTQLQLKWRADRTPGQRYKVFLQLLDSNDQVIAQHDIEPAGDSRPTDTWAPGEVILDNRGLLIPPGTPPGTYRRIVGLYDRDTLERLRLPDGTDHVDLPPITVARTKTPPPLTAFNMEHAQSFDFGGITLLGHDRYKRGFAHEPDAPLYPGDRLHLTFYWQAHIAPRADWWLDLALSDNTGQTVTKMQAPLVGETYSTTLWTEGEIVRGEHDLVLPADLPPGNYRLSLVLLPDSDTPAGTAYLGTVKVSPPPSK